ncbi:MAG: hypothetical protein Q9P01_11065 [Anaerolineae bacterium]|nr:hypothetical protein [Anaerolineae bacterium]MDQ7035345.1 hypothetical protein [Anaerolineae bacterium]
MDKRLSELRATQPAVEIETIEVLTNPLRAMRDGIMMIPVILVGTRRWYHAPSLADLEAALCEDVD